MKQSKGTPKLEFAMRTILILAMTCALALNVSRAGDWEDALWGGLIGTATGLIVSELDSDIHPSDIVPALAGVGVLLGYSKDHYDDYDHYYHDDYGYGYNHRYGNSWYNGYYPSYYRSNPYRRSYRRRPQPAPVQKKAPKKTIRRQNLHPGVKIALIPVTLPSGITINMRILNVNGQFIGPQGEPYDQLPTAELLTKKYIAAN